MSTSHSHVVVVNPKLHGYEYGSLRDLESEIVRITGAARVSPEGRTLPSWMAKRLRHGTRYGVLRRLIPRAEFDVRADVSWVVLMGPENFDLDFYRGWTKRVGLKILYVFDTFP